MSTYKNQTSDELVVCDLCGGDISIGSNYHHYSDGNDLCEDCSAAEIDSRKEVAKHTGKTIGELTNEEAREALLKNDYNWYVVQYFDGSFDCKHDTSLSAILECGQDASEYNIEEMWKCWNGEEVGEYPF